MRINTTQYLNFFFCDGKKILFHNKNEISILDYKTGIKKQQDVKQVKNYRFTYYYLLQKDNNYKIQKKENE